MNRLSGRSWFIFRISDSAYVWTSVAFLLVYTSWVWAGLRPSFHLVTVVVAAGILAGLCVGGGSSIRMAVLRDPFFWIGLAFLCYLFLQYLNAGRAPYFDVGYQRWAYTPPRWRGLPWVFFRKDALQILTWFFPAWTIVLAVRSPLLDQHALHRLFLLVAYNSGLLALFGLAQFVSHTGSIYWHTSLEYNFFASFAYTNHAAAFFVLTGALSSGLLYREIFHSEPVHSMRSPVWVPHHPRLAAGLAAVLVLCLTGANLSLSRAGVILAWVLAFFVAGYGLIRGWRILPPAGRVNFLAGTIAAAAILFFVVAGFGDKEIRHEFTPKTPVHHVLLPVLDNINLAMGARPLFARAAVRMWQDYPWLGVGGWGYKYLISDYVPVGKWKELATEGWANVHCDALQFLVEFGVVGFGLLLGALAWLLFPVFRRPRKNRALWVMSLIGLSLVVVFSLIDLPFRCPAIIYTWLLVLAALPKMTARTEA